MSADITQLDSSIPTPDTTLVTPDDVWVNLIGKVQTFEFLFEEIADTYILFKHIVCTNEISGKTHRLLRDHMWLRYTKKFKKLNDGLPLDRGTKLRVIGKLNRYRTKKVIKLPSFQNLHIYVPNVGEWRYTITNIKSIELLLETKLETKLKTKSETKLKPMTKDALLVDTKEK